MDMDIPFAQWIDEQVMVAGQPSHSDFAMLARQGFKVVIDMRQAHENPKPELEKKWSDQAGLVYIHFPVGQMSDFNEQNAQRLAKHLAEHARSKVLVHCVSANRVGAMFALKAYYVDRQNKDQALKAGERAGLKGLRPTIENLIPD